MLVLEFLNLFFGGLLAGAELLVRLGVRAPLATLGDQPQIELRQALIRTLRIVVPALYLPTITTGIAATALNVSGTGFGLQCAAVLALLVWTLTTFAGTVPINVALLDWQPTAPPADWRERIHRWELLDTVRTYAAVAAFALFLTAAALQSNAR